MNFMLQRPKWKTAVFTFVKRIKVAKFSNLFTDSLLCLVSMKRIFVSKAASL